MSILEVFIITTDLVAIMHVESAICFAATALRQWRFLNRIGEMQAYVIDLRIAAATVSETLQ